MNDPECCDAARQTGLSLRARNRVTVELTVNGQIELSLRLRQWLHWSSSKYDFTQLK
jgi:hypothetical protein